jgi:ABC-2 type transport system ATP-binding protein
MALDGLSLEIRRGEVFGILGHNGAGKTTFLRLVNGLLRPTAGVIETFGSPAYENGATHRRRTGVVTESTALDDFLTIRESLVAYGTMAGMSFGRIDARVEQVLALFDLTEVADKQVRQLSAGMRQRAAFGRGLVHEPELLLLDEPTANMDPVAARQVRHIVTDMARKTGRTVLLSTHNLAEAQDVCDRIAVLRRGRLQALGTMLELSRIVGQEAGSVIITTDPECVVDALSIAARFGDARPDGRPHRIDVERVDVRAVPKLVEALVEGGVPVRGVREVEPTLEEVYLALHHAGGTS